MTAIFQSRSLGDFEQETLSFCRTLGFRTFSATVVLDRPDKTSQFLTVDNTPEGFREIFLDLEYCSGDPVMQHCKVHSTPIAWDQSTYLAEGKVDRWERQATHGYRCGIALALHLPRGRHFFVGLDRDEPLPQSTSALTDLLGRLSLFVLHANEAAAQVLLPVSPESRQESLSPRELEVLRWTLEGKTAWEVGMILGISARTAAIHANNAAHKVGCTSKHQAALRALRLGWL